MDEYIINRRRETAAQIMEAMARAGLSRKEFAAKMGKNPSEVTRWLSGKHNFTSDLLAQISFTLGTDITGVPAVPCSTLVDGYESMERKSYLNDSGAIAGLCPLPSMSVSLSVYKGLCTLAGKSGISLAAYAERILALESSKALPNAADFAGILTDENYPDADEMVARLRGLRKFRRAEEL